MPALSLVETTNTIAKVAGVESSTVAEDTPITIENLRAKHLALLEKIKVDSPNDRYTPLLSEDVIEEILAFMKKLIKARKNVQPAEAPWLLHSWIILNSNLHRMRSPNKGDIIERIPPWRM